MTVYPAGRELSTVVISATVAEGDHCLSYMGCVVEARFIPFVAFIRERKESEGWSIREMAARLPGVGRNAIERWVSGEMAEAPELETLEALARGLHVSLRSILGKLGFEVNGPEITEADLARYRMEFGLTPDEAAVLAQLSPTQRRLLIDLGRQMLGDPPTPE